MAEEFLLIPGRSSKQGVSLNEGKYTEGYQEEISTLRMDPADMQRLDLAKGDLVRMWNDVGEVVVPCVAAPGELQPSMVFICYGEFSSRLMGGETHGSGMPDSKALDVFLEKHSVTPISDSAVDVESSRAEQQQFAPPAVVTSDDSSETAADNPLPTDQVDSETATDVLLTTPVETISQESTPPGQIAVLFVVLIVVLVWALNFVF